MTGPPTGDEPAIDAADRELGQDLQDEDVVTLDQARAGGTTTYSLKTIEQAVKLGCCLPHSWFRGAPRMYGNLTPTAFRHDYSIEFGAAERFRQRARRLSQVPAWDDHLGWLLMMQHYGTPTRLLDWTKSVLVALYFATAEPLNEPGEIWCMRPDALNLYSNWEVCGPAYAPIQYLATEVFLEEDEMESVLARLRMKDRPDIPIAFIPSLEFPRLATQLSRFTIHPRPTGTSTIPNLLKEPADLVRYRIPAESKRELCNDLSALGITHETLFQSLETLSKTILQEVAVQTYEPREPPQFD